MRSALHKFFVLCGAALVVLRFVPAEPGGYLSKIFFDDVVHERLDGLGLRIISSFGFGTEQFQTQLSGLTSLAHVLALIVEALGIALTFYIITRWI